MSAFFVSNEHMNEVVHLLFRNPRHCPEALRMVDPTKMGRALHRMNAEALRQRYGDEDIEIDFTYDPAKVNRALPERDRIKLARSLGYQCTEGSVPETNPLYTVLYDAIHNLEMALGAAGEEAPWSC